MTTRPSRGCHDCARAGSPSRFIARWFRSVALVAGLLAAVSARADDAKPLVHPLFSDGAVLQRAAEVPVWGWAAPGEMVTVTFAGQKKSAAAGADGRWLVRLRSLRASAEPRELVVTASCASGVAHATNVLVGDVWLCSGQSNMEMGIGVCNVPDEIAAADYPQIRLLTVGKAVRHEPMSTTACAWLECSPQTVIMNGWGGFTAAGYFFGRELHRQLKIPIGLIHSSWGGTICEAWASAEGLAPLADFKGRLEEVADTARARREGRSVADAREAWYAKNDPGTTGGWCNVDADESAWKSADMPREWQQAGLPDFDGVAWLRRDFEAPADWAGQDLLLELGPVDDFDTSFFNGEAVGGQDNWQTPRAYRLPGRLVKAGRNVIAIRVLDNAGMGGLTGRPEQLRVSLAGSTQAVVSLAGPWKLRDSVALAQVAGRPPGTLDNNPNVSTVLFNGMIAPLLPFAIKGAIWYQGESNAGRGQQYRSLLPAMITDWRRHFGVGDFPFYIVSLAAFGQPCAAPVESDWAELREAQALTAKNLKNCGLAVALDVGEADDIHPKNKLEVGRRLALAALAQAYGKRGEYSGPWYRKMKSKSGSADGARPGSIRLYFDHDTGLVAKGGALTGFSVAGADRKFVPADAVIDGDTVVISSPAVAQPVAVRYAWHANPVCNLYNRAGLPAVPFRTDDWPGVTDGRAY